MKRILSIASLVLVASLCAMAQEYPKAEVFGGYSFLHVDHGSGFRTLGGENLHGWHASVTANLNSWFGLTADFSGHYDSSSSMQVITPPLIPGLPPIPSFSTTAKSDTNIHTILVGPRFSYRKNKKITPFGHVLFGPSRRHVHSEVSTLDFGRLSFSANDTSFAGAVGGGLDVSLGGNLALRVIQADYLLSRAFGNNTNNARVSTGIVFWFGK